MSIIYVYILELLYFLLMFLVFPLLRFYIQQGGYCWGFFFFNLFLLRLDNRLEKNFLYRKFRFFTLFSQIQLHLLEYHLLWCAGCLLWIWQYFNNNAFPDDWKKGNIVQVHKKNSKQWVNYYLFVSLLPKCSKNFEKLIFDSIFNFIIQNSLLNSYQSSFRPKNSCVNQLFR